MHNQHLESRERPMLLPREIHQRGVYSIAVGLDVNCISLWREGKYQKNEKDA